LIRRRRDGDPATLRDWVIPLLRGKWCISSAMLGI
jgi:hypothetical protein